MTVPHRARHTALLRRGRGQLPSAGRSGRTVAGQSRRGEERGHRQPRHGGPGRGVTAAEENSMRVQ